MMLRSFSEQLHDMQAEELFMTAVEHATNRNASDLVQLELDRRCKDQGKTHSLLEWITPSSRQSKPAAG